MIFLDRDWFRANALRLVLAALLYGTASWLSFSLTQRGSGLAVMWLANGLVLATMLRVPRSDWPAYLAVAVAVNVGAALATDHPCIRALTLALCNALEVTVAALSLSRLPGGAPHLLSSGSDWRFLLIAGVLAPSGSALLAATATALIWHEPFTHRFSTWLLTHGLGMAVVTPIALALLRVAAAGFGGIFARSRRRATLAWLAIYYASLLVVFSQSRYPILFVLPPLLLGVIMQIGPSVITLCVLPLAAVACVATALGHGPFMVPDLSAGERIVFVQLFVLAALAVSLRGLRLQSDAGRDRAALETERDRVSASELGYRMLAEYAFDVVLRTDVSGRVVYCSPSSERVLGMKPDTLLSMSAADLVHPEDHHIQASMRAQLLASEVEEVKVAYRIYHPDGRTLWIEAGARLLRHPVTGAPDGYVSILRDVTERVRLEAEGTARERALEHVNLQLERLMRHLARARDQAEQASRAKSRFLAGISHELRTPLNGLLGHAQLLRIEGTLRPGQSKHVDAMLDAGSHLLRMINSVLDLSQIEAERLDLRPSSIDVAALTRACLDLVRPTATAKGLWLNLDVGRGASLIVMADPMRLRQVLLNLLGNAIKFTASGGVSVRVRATGHDSVRFEIADTGSGIPPSLRPRLFRDFDRLDIDAARDVEGAGLGLALSERLATLMGGTIGHEDNPGGGSLFFLDLPGLDAVAMPVTASETRLLPSPGDTSLSILVTDDIAMNRDIACALLRSAGHQATEASSGAEAIEAVRTTRYDAVIMDVRMPGMDGLEATRRIRALPSPVAGVPIVALTAQAFSEQLEQCRIAGMDGHVTKPVTREALLDAIASARRTRADQGVAAASAGRTLPAAPPSARPAPPPPEGTDAPLFDSGEYHRLTTLLEAEAVSSCLATLVERSEALLHDLASPSFMAGDAPGLAASAHALAGSSGTFGFRRLALLARQFERALGLASPDLGPLVALLAGALRASLPLMRDPPAPDTAGASRSDSGPDTSGAPCIDSGQDAAGPPRIDAVMTQI